MHTGTHTLYRPPSEANSLILRVANGCPWNACLFCGMYKGVRYRILSPEKITETVDVAAREYPQASRVFLADGDVMAMPYADLRALLELLNETFPHLARVNLYANGHSIASKTAEQLGTLRRFKLTTLYMGLESGDDETLGAMRKRETADEMVAAAQRAQEAGLRMSVMFLIGLGGRQRTMKHAQGTLRAVNAMQPKFLSALRVIPVPNTPLPEAVRDGRFTPVSEHGAVAELREIVAGLELHHTVFRANHTSNVVPIGGRFPKDKPRLLGELDALLASGLLDRDTPGNVPRML